MTPTPAFSLRNVPPAIYVGLGIGALGVLTYAFAWLAASGGEIHERYEAVERWRLMNQGCDTAYTIMIALGILEVAKRHTGAPRVLAKLAAGLTFASLAWLLVLPLIAIAEPRSEYVELIYNWMGRVLGVVSLAAAVLLTIAADAWRRVPIAAAGLLVLHLTAYWIPVLGKEIGDLMRDEQALRQVYVLVRTSIRVITILFIVAALAAGGRDPAPEPAAGRGGFQLARGALIFRMVAAVVIALLLVGGRSAGTAKVVVFTGPAVLVITMILFALGLQRVASSRIHGMPRWRFTIGATLTLWWCGVQFEQLMNIVELLKNESSRSERMVDMFSIAGPIVATLGVALAGSAIIAFAANRANAALNAAATSRTIAFVALTLAGIGLPAMAIKAGSIGTAMMILLLAAGAGIAGLVIIAGLFGRAASEVDTVPEIPPARVVR